MKNAGVLSSLDQAHPAPSLIQPHPLKTSSLPPPPMSSMSQTTQDVEPEVAPCEGKDKFDSKIVINKQCCQYLETIISDKEIDQNEPNLTELSKIGDKIEPESVEHAAVEVSKCGDMVGESEGLV